MLDPKALLDSLMGNDRNADKKVVKSQTFQDAWKKDDVCKDHLVWNCPNDFWLNDDGNPCPKSPFSKCHKQHSEAMKLRFQKDSDYERYRSVFLQDLERKMRKLVADVDAKIELETTKLEKGESRSQMHVKSHLEAHTARVEAKLKEANKLGASGELEVSQSILEDAKEKQARLDKLKGINEERLDKICDVCGLNISWQDAGANGFGTAHGHYLGGVHMGWVQLRDSHARLQEEIKKLPPGVVDPRDNDNCEAGLKDGRRRGRTSGRGRSLDLDRDFDENRRRDGRRSPDDEGARRFASGREQSDSYRASDDGRRPSRGASKERKEDGRRRGRSDLDEDFDERRRERDTRRDRDRSRDREDRYSTTNSRGRLSGRSRDRGAARNDGRAKRREPDPRDEFGRSTKIAKYESDDAKSIFVEYSDDWQDVMEAKFNASRLSMDAWDMKAFDSDGAELDVGSPDTQLSVDSFPLQFKFKRKKTV